MLPIKESIKMAIRCLSLNYSVRRVEAWCAELWGITVLYYKWVSLGKYSEATGAAFSKKWFHYYWLFSLLKIVSVFPSLFFFLNESEMWMKTIVIRRNVSLFKLHTSSQNDHLRVQCISCAAIESIKKIGTVQEGRTWSLLKRLNLNFTISVTIETDSQFYLLCLKSWNLPLCLRFDYHSVRNVNPRVSNNFWLMSHSETSSSWWLSGYWAWVIPSLLSLSGFLHYLLPPSSFVLSCSACPSSLFLLLTVSSDSYITSRRRSVTGRK